MINTSLIIKALDNDNAVSKTISGVNSEATMTQINDFARKMNSLSTQTYVDTVRVTKESVNEAISD